MGLAIVTWSIASCVVAELLGYWLHRLLHSGLIGFLSRNHMKHHMVFYGPQQKQRTPAYLDATDGSVSLGNIGTEWLLPAALVIGASLAGFHYFHVRLVYQLLFLGITLAWSFLMFSYLHDAMHIEGIWLEKNRWLRPWFVAARRLHDIHHHEVNSSGIMDKNFGIGFFWFDRVFGTLSPSAHNFNSAGYKVARVRFKGVLEENETVEHASH